MLPIFKNKKMDGGGMSIVHFKDLSKDESEADGIEIAMRDFQEALELHDHKAMAKAFREAFDMLELEPHEENMENHEQDTE